MSLIRITPDLAIDEHGVELSFVRASGPGGQNVNKVASAVRLRFDTGDLPEDMRDRLGRLAGRRLTTDGVLVIRAMQFRTQALNRQDAMRRLVELLRRAAVAPRPRRRVRAPPEVKWRRLTTKHRRAETKRHRRPVTDLDDG